MRIATALLIIFFFSILTIEDPAFAKKAKPYSASKSFAVAKKQFDQGKYKESLYVLSDLLKKYPDHTSAQMLMAKSFYRLERQNEAYALFSRMNPQFFDPETSYEFATTMYRAKQYPSALYGYKNVPKTHSLHDLANYYGALSAIKVRKFKIAEDMMERAVVLPNKLAKSRTQYLKHLTELRLLREKQEIAKQKKRERERLRKGKKTKNQKPRKAEDSGKVAEYTHAGSMNVSRAANVSIQSKNQISEFHGYAKDTAKIQITSFSFTQGPLWTFGKSMKRRTALGLQIAAGATDVFSKGNEQRNFVFDDSKDILRIQ
ncbi:hypothetical protein N9D31_00965, partial [Oligoflexaceae bacterium]|nr:hypothetical protein [Oligoflexaceae bacterium]